MATKYTCAIIFTKKGNLLDYLHTDKVSYGNFQSSPIPERAKEYYAKEREIELVLLTRYEDGKMYCRIKCPVNPMPVKGEFEAPSYSAIYRFLRENGWNYKQKIYPRMFE